MTALCDQQRTVLCQRKWRNTILNVALVAQFSHAATLCDLRSGARLRLTDANPKKQNL